MSIIDPPAGWDDVDGINTNERLLGGPDGPLNRAAKGLAARSKWLRQFVEEAGVDLASPTGVARVGYRARDVGSRLDDVVNVRDYGALGIGHDFDDSPAIAAAIAAATSQSKPLWFPPCPVYYSVGDVHIPRGLWVTGNGPRVYTASDGNPYRGTGGCVAQRPGSTNLFTWGGENTVTGITARGNARTSPFFATLDGARIGGMRAEYLCLSSFSIGIGNPSYLGINAYECIVSNCTAGISRIVDSKIIGGTVNANDGSGISNLTGENDNYYGGVKVEWNNGVNWNLIGCANVVVSGCITDRAALSNFNIEGATTSVTIIGGVSRRAGRGVGGGYNLRANGVGCLLVNGLLTVTGPNDGSGVVTPDESVRLSGANGKVVISASDLTGGVTGSLILDGNATFDYLSITDCPGYYNRRNVPGESYGSISVNAGATGKIPVKLISLASFGREMYQASLVYRASSVGDSGGAEVMLIVGRETGDATLRGAALISSVASSSRTWALGSSGTATVLVSLVDISADGASANVLITNNGTDTVTMQCTCRLKT